MSGSRVVYTLATSQRVGDKPTCQQQGRTLGYGLRALPTLRIASYSLGPRHVCIIHWKETHSNPIEVHDDCLQRPPWQKRNGLVSRHNYWNVGIGHPRYWMLSNLLIPP
jgi:hypothetical protein